MEDNMESRIIPILKVLSESSEPLGSTIVSRKLKDIGINLSERSVRYQVLITDIRGYTKLVVHDGRILTPKGLDELKVALSLTHKHSGREK
jgi:repressor of nif and glnA expression